MKRKTLLFILLITVVVFPQKEWSQVCRNYHKTKSCHINMEDFKLYGQSRSALLEINKESELNIIVYGKKDYKFIFCTEPRYYPIHYVFFDTNTGKVLYDNMDNEYIEIVGFTFDKTQQITIKTTILAEKIDPNDFNENRACVGIKILWRNSPKIGF